jgi:hypothetical protein
MAKICQVIEQNVLQLNQLEEEEEEKLIFLYLKFSFSI